MASVSSQTVRRRLAAIVVADVVGYARLMERDEAGTLERLKALRRDVIEPALARHGGRITELQGDGAVAEFGSVVSAVQACVEEIRGKVHGWRCYIRTRALRALVGLGAPRLVGFRSRRFDPQLAPLVTDESVERGSDFPDLTFQCRVRLIVEIPKTVSRV